MGQKNSTAFNNGSNTIKSPKGNGSERTVKNKKALIIGLNYTGKPEALKGCINDARRMEKTLKTKFKYKDILVLTDKDVTTKRDIITMFEKFVNSDNDILFFQYAGHGLQTHDWNGDEEDGLDEAIYCPDGSKITDDEFNSIVKNIKKHQTLIFVMDCCHSGSIVDLPYLVVNDHVLKTSRQTIQGNIICISGCKDNQVSADVTKNSVSYGAMSNCLQIVLKRIKKDAKWIDLIDELQKEIRSHRYSQIPQMTLSKAHLANSEVNL